MIILWFAEYTNRHHQFKNCQSKADFSPLLTYNVDHIRLFIKLLKSPVNGH